MAETFISTYRLFALCFALETDFGTSFDELRNDFSDGFDSSQLIGSDEGLKSWSLSYDNLTNFNQTYTLRGYDYGMADYLWNLFLYSTRTGEPFVILCPRNNQYYFARFNETQFSLKRKLTNFYGAGVSFIQRRIKGVSIFDTEKAGAMRDYRSTYFAEDYADNDPIIQAWHSSVGGLTGGLDYFGNPTFQTNEQNNLPVVRFDGTDDYFKNTNSLTIKESFIVCKFRGASFSGYKGLLTGVDNSSAAPLVTNNSGTVFLNQSFPNFTYKLNGIEYAQTDMQAPMNTFGLVHIRAEDGFSLDGLQLGKNKSQAGSFGAWDIGQAVICSSLLTEEQSTETAAHLMRIWGLG